MKKFVLVSLLLAWCAHAACAAELKTIEKLRIAVSPYDAADAIMAKTAPLGGLLQAELQKHGYDVKAVEVAVSSSYQACAEALSAGTADAGFISCGTYVSYAGEVELLLTALRRALSKDSLVPKDWNDGTPEKWSETQLSEYHRCVILAGPSAKGRELAAKVNAGEKLSWDDLNSATWCVLGATSSTGYIYPCLWLQANYGKTIRDLAHVVQASSHSASMARLAAEQADVAVSFAHIRLRTAKNWTGAMKRPADIWHETNVLGVTQGVYNDTVCVSPASPIMDEQFKKALGTAFIDLAKTPEGQNAIAAFSQVGYMWGKDANYDGERQARELLKSLQ